MPTNAVLGGEGVAIFTTPKQTLFRWPPPRDGADPSATPDGFWPGAFVLTLDLSWLREDEELALSVLLRMSAGGEAVPLFTTTLGNTSPRALWQSRPIYSLYGCEFTATQTKGAADVRMPWWVARADGGASLSAFPGDV